MAVKAGKFSFFVTVSIGFQQLCNSLKCGIEINRDVNAARNILRLAQAMSSARVSAGEFGSEVKHIYGI